MEGLSYKEVLEDILTDLRENPVHPQPVQRFFSRISVIPETNTTEEGDLQGVVRMVAKTAHLGDLTFIVSPYIPDFDGADPPDEAYQYLVSWLVSNDIKNKFQQFTIKHEQIQTHEN